MRKLILAVVALMMLTLPGCDETYSIPDPYNKNDDKEENKDDKTQGDTLVVPVSEVLSITPIAGLNRGEAVINSHKGGTTRSSLDVDYRSRVTFSSAFTLGDYPVYPRMTRAADGTYLLFYHQGNSTTWAGNQNYLMTSTDLLNWTSKGLFNAYKSVTDDFGASNKRAYAGANVLRLSNGDLLCVASYRILSSKNGHSYRENQKSSGLWLRRSKDNGKTWDTGMSIHTGLTWEPHLLELPSGEIHCYFTDASELINLSSWPKIYNNSGTSLVTSSDGGYHWTSSIKVVRQERDHLSSQYLFTDQMPVVISLNETGELVGAFESNMAKATATSTNYNISLAYSGEGKTFPALTGNATGPADRVSSFCKGCAPFLVQFPSGETVLTYNESSKMYMRIGDEKARQFGAQKQFFANGGFWGGLYVDGTHRLLAAVGGSGQSMYFECLYLNHDIAATSRTVTTDGSNKEWKATDEALFVGSKSQAQATLRCSADADSVYFLVEVMDENIASGDYVSIYVSAPDAKALGATSRRYQLSLSGIKKESKWSSGWKDEKMGSSARSGMEGTPDDASDKDAGWICELAVPRTQLPVQSGKVAVNLALFDASGGEDALRTSSSLSTWPIVSGL